MEGKSGMLTVEDVDEVEVVRGLPELLGSLKLSSQ